MGNWVKFSALDCLSRAAGNWKRFGIGVRSWFNDCLTTDATAQAVINAHDIVHTLVYDVSQTD